MLAVGTKEKYVVGTPSLTVQRNKSIAFFCHFKVLWSGIGVKIKVAFHCTDLAFYAVLFEFNVASVAFSCHAAN